MEKDKQNLLKELENSYNYYHSEAVTQLQRSRWGKVYIGVSIFAFFFLLTINHYDLNDAGWILGYAGCWLICLFLFFMLYAVLPKKWKWIGKPFTKQQKYDKMNNLLKNDIYYSKRAIVDLENELSVSRKALEEKCTLRDLISKNLGEWPEVFF